MANNNTYKGITVKFGADTTQLGKALKDIDTQAKGVSADIKEIDKGLKLDPKNVELTAQKFQRLTEGIQITQKRLEMLRAAQASAQDDLSKGVEGAEQRYKDLQREIAKTETTLGNFKKQVKDAGDAMKRDMLEPIDKLKDKLDSLKKKTETAAIAAVGASLIKIVKDSVGSYAEYEQLVGGVETLFKSSSDQVLKYAENAYKTAGLSANQYLDTVTSFSASLLQGLNGDTAKAARISDQAITDMADNANKMGTSMQSIQNAYQGFAKQNYTMLDNLKLGYGGTASEMARLINDSGVLGDQIEVTAKTVNSVSFDKMIEAIHKVQTELGITGTTAEEAEKTISGSLNAVKAAWSNLMTGLGDETADVDKLTKRFTDSLHTFIDNVKPVLKQTLKSIGATLEEILPEGLISGLEFLYDVVSRIGKLFAEHGQAVMTLVASYKALKTAASIGTIIQTTITALKGLKAATDAAAVSQQGMNAAASVNPYVAIGTAVVFATEKIFEFVAASYEASAAFGEFFDKVDEELHKNNEAVKSYDQLKDKIDQNRESRQKAAADIEGEYYGYEKLIDRLYELSEVEKKSDADKAEMAEIVGKLEKGVDGLSIAYNKETCELKTQRDELEKNIEKSKEFMLAKAALANQEIAAQDLASAELDKNKLEREFNELHKSKKDSVRRLAEKYSLEEESIISKFISNLEQIRVHKEIEGEDTSEIDKEIESLQELEIQETQVSSLISDVEGKITELQGTIKDYQELIDKNSEALEKEKEAEKEAADAAETVAEAEKEAADASEKLSEAYETAKSKVSAYKSELTALISELDKVNAGTKYSTTQILDLIDKYPELAEGVHLTAEGYEIQADSIQKLIEKKAELMLTEAREAEAAANQSFDQISERYAYERSRAAMSHHGEEHFSDEFQEEYDEAERKVKNAAKLTEALEKIYSDIRSGNYSKGNSSSGSSKQDATDYWEKAAEDEVAQVEHLYKMGEISAEEYYRRLEEINRRYYENRAEYLTEYNKLAETVYSGLKKQQEEQISNAKTLLDRINDVKNARRELENAENQKVSVYSSAAGFHAEQDTAAIDKASTALQSKTLELASLLQQKYGQSISLPQLSSLDLAGILPDLSGIRIPSAASRQQTVNVEYKAGDVYISGSADSGTVDRLKALMNTESKKFFDEYLSDYLDQADRDRQTGG